MNVLPKGADLFHADRRLDMTQLIVVYRNFANATKMGELITNITTCSEL